jgi:hypothetical protein
MKKKRDKSGQAGYVAIRANPDSNPSQRSLIEHFLGLFTEVRFGEGATALLMFANVFLILCA